MTLNLPNARIYSWPEELLNLDYKLPKNFLLWDRWHDVFDNFNYDRNQILTELSEVENYQQLLKESPLFPDNSHVIRSEYKKLVHRILKML
jgi:hypothetical protein